ncbi:MULTISPECIES: acyl carrier protein [Rickettsia]|nr:MULTISPECIES: acyl carrier protein [Rickettsia]MCC8370235.1 acyl carrier protein [Rickettsia endosymbiont of Stiretrus anchorago]HJD62252.1 acyl carrier protein [Rickettsia endosymbiont of Degeeriella rufa]HJD65454.1 acyl carrier protein [Rickettsia endosymbiont of Diachasma alloeum]HJD66465.1 acyl carrier protein [Rickettsia endosymbiont of Bembidion nr. Transversale]HJD67842.1 acyl carrier protein [Rickettsia endosymbiont of Bembidion lapponicum]
MEFKIMSKVDNIEQKVIKIIADNQGKKIEEISVDSRFAEDLGVDSLSTVEIMMEIEKEFGVDVPDEEATKIKKVADVVNYIKEHKS